MNFNIHLLLLFFFFYFFFFYLFIFFFFFFFFFFLGGGGGQEIESLWRMQILWILFGGSSQNYTIFGFIFMHLQVFFKFNV